MSSRLYGVCVYKNQSGGKVAVEFRRQHQARITSTPKAIVLLHPSVFNIVIPSPQPSTAMALRLLQHTITAAILASTAFAQTRNIIPSDLTTGFNDKEVQVSFSATAVDGFASGTTFEKTEVATEPTFALGDSNGITPSTRYTLVMIDTTCPNARTLHYVRSNFKFAFAGGTNIETESPPLLEYKAPGAFGEQGDGRQYVFLMYTNPQRREFTQMQLPSEGDVFDVKKFQGDNGLNDPVAGVGMVVKLGGTAECGNEGANPVPTGTGASATGSAGVSTTGRLSATSAAGASSALTPVQSRSASGSVPRSSSALAATSTGSVETSASAVSSTALQTDEAAEPTSAASTASLSRIPASGTDAPTPTGSAIEQQTANAASEAVVGQSALFMYLLAGATVFVW